MCDSNGELFPAAFGVNLGLGAFILITTLVFYYDTLFRGKSEKMIKKESVKDVQMLKNVALLTLFFYSCGVITYFVHFCLPICDYNRSKKEMFAFGTSFHAFGTLCVFVLFSFPLNFTFKNTMFAISNRIKQWLIIITIIVGMGHIANVISQFVTPRKGDTSGRVSSTLGAASLSFLVLNEFILLGIFVRKLGNVIQHCVSNFGVLTQPQLNKLNKSVTASRNTSVDPYLPDASGGVLGSGNKQSGGDFATFDTDKADGGGDISHESMDNLKSLVRLISDMSKYTILVSIAICSTFLLAAELPIMISGFNEDRFPYVAILFMIDSVINTICLVLQFVFYKKEYYCFCGKIHSLCEDRYTKKTNQENKDKNNGYKLKRLESGEIGIVREDVLANKQPDLTSIKQNGSNNASLSVGATANLEQKTSNSNNNNGTKSVTLSEQVDGASIATNEVKMIAQKSAELQLGD